MDTLDLAPEIDVWKGRAVQIDSRKSEFLAVATCLLLLSTGCTVGDDRERPEAGALTSASSGSTDPQTPLLPPLPQGGRRLSCADSVATVADPGELYRIEADSVAVSSQVLQPNESGDGQGPSRLFAKWGLHVRTGAAVELQVAPGWEDRVRIGWGPAARPVTTVQVEACPATGTSAAWSVFTGGTWVAGPACVPLVIRSQRRQVDVRLAIGVMCDESPPR
ncbi:hypothetical protein ABZ671_29940 [Micromonospora sp. NPDC006766]|uniref:hypothetical protein n=1 Tax=Micromonospora sp. NPDC006766 TaxID=3154778 RepID=UPI0033DD374F